jgi:hypothetical protein
VQQSRELQVKTQSESWSSDPGGNVATNWLVQEFQVQENWRCASLKTPKAPKLEELK